MRRLLWGIVAVAALAIIALFVARSFLRDIGAPRGDQETAVAASFDTWRPCTLLNVDEAAQVARRPVHQRLSDNRVLGEGVICSYSVGQGGMHGFVQLTIVHGGALETPDAYFARRCAEGGPVEGDLCRLKSGLLVARIGAVVAEASVQDMMGAVQSSETEALLALVRPRIAGTGA